MSIWPRDKAVKVGSEATFICTTNDSQPCFIWEYRPVADNVSRVNRYVCDKTTTKNILVEPKCNVTVNNSSKTGRLAINDVQLNDSGLYKCGDCYSHESSEARLTVIGKRSLIHSFGSGNNLYGYKSQNSRCSSVVIIVRSPTVFEIMTCRFAIVKLTS